MPRFRFTVRRLMLVVALFGLVCFAFDQVIIKPRRDQMHWHRRIRADYQLLAGSRPGDVGRGQWEFLVCWTRNLHGNWGTYYGIRDIRRAEAFADALEDRLRHPVSMATIDWIWDEYQIFAPGSRRYDTTYRPTRSPDLATALPGCFAQPVP